MPRDVPLSLLKAFEAAGRTGSFRAAAEELHLSPSAISHAVRKLEQALNTALFVRTGREVHLNNEGDILMRHVGAAFERLRLGMDLVSPQGPKLLRLHCAPSFAAQWLTPRLSSFLAANPGVELRIAAGPDYTNFSADDFDADIVYGRPRQSGLHVIPLAEETLTPLCSPTLAETIRTPADLYDQVLIESDNKQMRWDDWFSLNGSPSPPPRGPRFDRSFLAIAFAADGLGVALESLTLASAELASGRLVAPLAGSTESVRYVGHYLAFPKAARRRKVLRIFISWLMEELGLDPAIDF